VPERASLFITVYGLVQGVYFRSFVMHHAVALSLTGYVRNLPGERSVEIRAEGERKQLEKLINYVKVGPPGARVEKVETEWSEYSGKFPLFEIRYRW
jgi:acylphosphatase